MQIQYNPIRKCVETYIPHKTDLPEYIDIFSYRDRRYIQLRRHRYGSLIENFLRDIGVYRLLSESSGGNPYIQVSVYRGNPPILRIAYIPNSELYNSPTMEIVLRSRDIYMKLYGIIPDNPNVETLDKEFLMRLRILVNLVRSYEDTEYMEAVYREAILHQVLTAVSKRIYTKVEEYDGEEMEYTILYPFLLFQRIEQNIYTFIDEDTLDNYIVKGRVERTLLGTSIEATLTFEKRNVEVDRHV